MILPSTRKLLINSSSQCCAAITFHRKAVQASDIEKQVHEEHSLKLGMTARYETWVTPFAPDHPIKIWAVYAKDGSFVGDVRMARALAQLEIVPQCYGTNTVASIGYSSASHAWYGWSHRAIHAFDGNEADDQVKQQAIDFAESMA